MPLTRLTAIADLLCQLIARHGHLRRLPGPLVVLLWQRVRGITRQVEGLLARLRAGHLRRCPARRPPRPGPIPRRTPAQAAFPTPPAWLIALIPETAVSAVHLRTLLAAPDVPALLQAAPQLRRALRPLCRMLDVSLPRPLTPTPPEAPPASAAPAAPAPAAPRGHPRRRSSAPPSRAAHRADAAPVPVAASVAGPAGRGTARSRR
jgi:hypothetical protein